MARIKVIGYALILLVFTTAGCGEKADPLSGLAGLGGTPTYVQDVKALLDQHCLPCHSTAKSGAQRNGAPIAVNFDTYELAVANIERAGVRIQAGTMPPAGGLEPAIRTIILDWLATGTPRGEP